jgi:hypothetical protein
MHENSFEGDEELGNDCAILKKMQTTIRMWATPFSYIRLAEFSSYNHLSFFSILSFWVVEPLARGWRNGVSLIYFFGWVIALVSGFFCKGCDSGLSGCYLIFCEGQYVVKSWANRLGRADMQVRRLRPLADFGLWAEQKPGCQSPFSRLSGRFQAHVRSPLPPASKGGEKTTATALEICI